MSNIVDRLLSQYQRYTSLKLKEPLLLEAASEIEKLKCALSDLVQRCERDEKDEPLTDKDLAALENACAILNGQQP